MKSLLKTLAATGFAGVIGLAAISNPAFAEKPKWTNKSDDTIVDFAVNASGGIDDFDDNGEDFDILIKALLDTGTIAIFTGRNFTVFAPNDQAFYDLTETDNDSAAYAAVLSLLTVEQVGDVLAYHVTEGVVNSRAVTRAKQIRMLDGNTISGRTGLIEAKFSTAGLLNIDNRLADGMVHTIDTVLLAIDPS